MKDYGSILKYAMQMELDGYNFFKEKAEKFSNASTKKMFEDIAEVEMEHYNFLREQLEEYEENQGFKLDSKAFDRDEKNIFENRAESEHIKDVLSESDIPDITILRMAYLIERDYAEFYRNVAENTEDEIAKQIFEKLAQWEEGHESFFKSEYDRRMKEYMNLPWGG